MFTLTRVASRYPVWAEQKVTDTPGETAQAKPSLHGVEGKELPGLSQCGGGLFETGQGITIWKLEYVPYKRYYVLVQYEISYKRKIRRMCERFQRYTT